MSTPAAPAPLWHRYAAWSLDAALVAMPVAVLAFIPVRDALADADLALAALLESALGVMLEMMPRLPLPEQLLADPAVQDAANALADALVRALLVPGVLFAVGMCVWGAGFEARSGATPGKRAFGLEVTVESARMRPSALRALLRQVAGMLSWLTFNLGHLLAALPPGHQALHDRVTRTRVVQLRPVPEGRVRGWLGLQAVAALAALVWMVIVLQQGLDSALLRLGG